MNTRLKGKNQIRQFREAAERLVSKIKTCNNVAGIAFLGGLVRAFADKHSDLDIMVFLDKRDELLRRQLHKIGIEEGKHSGIDIDLEIHYLRDFERWKWNETDRWDFSHAGISFDPNGQIKKMFRAKLKVSGEFWIRHIAICAEYMKWYCCPPREGVGTIAEAWIDRGDVLSAHYCLNYSVELLFKIVFALNKEFLPPEKWRVFYFHNLKWLPRNHRLLNEAIIIRDLSAEDLSRRLRALRKIWQATLPKIEEATGLTPNQITKYYVEKVLHQTLTH
jgi:predicted nucleotidyltransferase